MTCNSYSQPVFFNFPISRASAVRLFVLNFFPFVNLRSSFLRSRRHSTNHSACAYFGSSYQIRQSAKTAHPCASPLSSSLSLSTCLNTGRLLELAAHAGTGLSTAYSVLNTHQPERRGERSKCGNQQLLSCPFRRGCHTHPKPPAATFPSHRTRLRLVSPLGGVSVRPALNGHTIRIQTAQGADCESRLRHRTHNA